MALKSKKNSPRIVIKRLKKLISIAEKLKILNTLQGEKIAALERHFEINESTILLISDNEKKNS